MANLQTLKNDVEQWFKQRDLIRSENEYPQTLKLVSEVGELADAIIKHDENLAKDAVGDVLVVLIGLCAIKGWDMADILEEVYGIISQRKGLTVNGVFIKKEDFFKMSKEDQKQLFEKASFKDLA